MEYLTKQQIILLALLVSFVSSIATGIVTVSLTEQGAQNAPVTETITRVVERTIERASSDNSQAAAAGSVTKETIVVRDDQALVDAIAKANKAIVRVYWSFSGSNENFIGIGFIANDKGRVIAKTTSSMGGVFTAHLFGGNVVTVMPVLTEAKYGITVFDVDQTADPQASKVFAGADLADSDKAQIGQSIAEIGGQDNPAAATGIVSSVSAGQKIWTSVTDDRFASQSVLVNLSGQVLGLKFGYASDAGFLPSNIMKTYATP